VLRRSAFLLALAVFVLGLGVVIDLQDSPQVRAGPPPAVTLREAAAVRDSGMAVALATRSVAGVGVLEPRPAAEVREARPLAASLDGSALALSTIPAGQVGPLTLARADGSQLEIALPGVRGAAFEPAGSWLAAVDLSGALWRVDAATGAATLIANGPFGPDVTVLADGDVLVVRMSSVEAPTWSRAERIHPNGEAAELLTASDDQSALVYRATALVDGSVALVRHRTGGGVDVVRVALDGLEMTIARSPHPGVTISPAGDRLAWAIDGTVWLGSVGDDPSPVAAGGGSAGSFSPDGSLLMVVGTDATGVVDLAGNRRSDLATLACWLGGGRGCRP
jgi:hypothetical protein